MSSRKGFTLIELLVVIAIIALLMAILMPVLARVKGQAQAVLCQSNLKQWSIIWALYTQDNDGYLHPGHCSGSSLAVRMDRLWYNATYKYYMGQDEILFCPTATDPNSSQAWLEGIWGPEAPGFSGRAGVYGSYGLNQWVANPIKQEPTIGNISMYWKTPGVKNAADVPVMGDACYTRVFPRHTDMPPAYELEFDPGTTGGGRPLSQYCINRHNSAINLLFLDWAVRRVRLKNLWDFKWHRGWNPENEPPPVWPLWMKTMPE